MTSYSVERRGLVPEPDLHRLTYDCPSGFEIGLARAGDGTDMAQVQARAMEAAYYNIEPRATKKALAEFFTDPGEQDFRQRKPKELELFVDGGQPDPAAWHILLVARKIATQSIVGIVGGKIPRQRLYVNVGPMGQTTDRVTALHVDPEYQRRGIGDALFRSIMSYLGSMVVLVTVKGTPAVEFYAKHHFRQRPSWEGGMVTPFFRDLIQLPRLAMSCEDNPYRPADYP